MTGHLALLDNGRARWKIVSMTIQGSRLHIVTSLELSAAQAVVQTAHIAAIAQTRWPESHTLPFVIHGADETALLALLHAHTAQPWRNGHDDHACWFAEPDLLWEPTAIAYRPGHPAPEQPLWTTQHQVSWHERALARRLNRQRFNGGDIWQLSHALFADTSRASRVSAALHLTGGRR